MEKKRSVKIKNCNCIPCEYLFEGELYYEERVFFGDRVAKVIYRHMDYEDQYRVIRFTW